MKHSNFLSSAVAAGFVLTTMASSVIFSPSAAFARDDWNNNRSDWNFRCDRDWNAPGCRDGNRNWDNNRYPNRRLASGTFIPTQSYRQGRLVLRRWERYPLTLVAENRVANNRSDRTVIPDSSLIRGALVPFNQGYRFESNSITFPNGRRETFAAVSRYLDSRDSFDPNNRDRFSLSPAALIALSYLFGQSNTPSPFFLGNAFNRYPNVRRDLVVVHPNQDLDLRLTRDFVLN